MPIWKIYEKNHYTCCNILMYLLPALTTPTYAESHVKADSATTTGDDSKQKVEEEEEEPECD